MKKVLLFFVTTIFGFALVNAQVTFGAKAGVNFSDITGEKVDSFEGLTSFHVGAVAEIQISEKFSVQPELIYSMQGSDYSEDFEGDDFEGSVKVNYLNIPLMAKYYVADGFSLEAGPQIGLLVSATDEYEDAVYPDMAPKDIIESRVFYDYNNKRLFEYSNVDIDCIANQPENDHAEIFLDCDGSVYPCCFIGSRINIGEKQLEMMVGDSNIVLSKENTIHNILDSKYFQKTMPDGMNGNFTGDLTLDNKTNHCITCVDCCGMKMELSHRR